MLAKLHADLTGRDMHFCGLSRPMLECDLACGLRAWKSKLGHLGRRVTVDQGSSSNSGEIHPKAGRLTERGIRPTRVGLV